MTPQPLAISLGSRLKKCRNALTLGVRPNLIDYPEAHLKLIQNAKKIYYPTEFYSDIFDTLGKATFPSYHSYKYGMDKIKQTALFQLLGIAHPQTRIFYGRRQKNTILNYFDFPFVGKIARGSARGRGVFLIENAAALEAYLEKAHPAYIQAYIPNDRDIRVVVIGRRVVLAYWRLAPEGDFRSNVACGGRIRLGDVPAQASELALQTARTCRWDDVGIDIRISEKGLYVLEANMKYGREGFLQAGIDYTRLMEELIANEEI